MRFVILFLCGMGLLIITLLFSYNWVLQIGHERRCGRIFTEQAEIEHCVELRRRGILLENLENN